MARSRFSSQLPVPKHPKAKPALKYDPEYCNTVRDFGQQGMFPEEWCAHIGVTMATLYNWANAYPEFEEACLISWYLLRAYWTEQARTSVQGLGMPPSVLIKVLESRFPDTWGKSNPRMTQEHFQERNKSPDQDAADTTTPEALQGMSRDDLQDRIKQLEARRAHGGETK